MATLKQRLHRKNAAGTFDTVHLESSSDLILRPSGRTVEQDLADYLPQVQNNDNVPQTLGWVRGNTKAFVNKKEIAFQEAVDALSGNSPSIIQKYQVGDEQNILQGDVVTINGDIITKDINIIMAVEKTYSGMPNNIYSGKVIRLTDDYLFVIASNINTYVGYAAAIVDNTGTLISTGSTTNNGSPLNTYGVRSGFIWKANDTTVIALAQDGDYRIRYTNLLISGTSISVGGSNYINTANCWTFAAVQLSDNMVFVCEPLAGDDTTYVYYAGITYESGYGIRCATYNQNTHLAGATRNTVIGEVVSREGNVYNLIFFRINTTSNSNTNRIYYHFVTVDTKGSVIPSDWEVTIGEDTLLESNVLAKDICVCRVDSSNLILSCVDTSNNLQLMLIKCSGNVASIINAISVGSYSAAEIASNHDGCAVLSYGSDTSAYLRIVTVINDSLMLHDTCDTADSSGQVGAIIYIEGNSVYVIRGKNTAPRGGSYVIKGNYIGGDIIISSQDGIALESGSAGDTVPVILQGIVQLDGISKGQEISSPGVYGYGAMDGQLSVFPYWMPDQVVIGTYTGNGDVSRFVYLGFNPKALCVFPLAGVMWIPGYTTGYYDLYGGFCLNGDPLTVNGNSALMISGNGFYCYYNTSGESTIRTNQNNNKYGFIAFK